MPKLRKALFLLYAAQKARRATYVHIHVWRPTTYSITARHAYAYGLSNVRQKLLERTSMQDSVKCEVKQFDSIYSYLRTRQLCRHNFKHNIRS